MDKFNHIVPECYKGDADYPTMNNEYISLLDDEWLNDCCGDLLDADVLDSWAVVQNVTKYWPDRIAQGELQHSSHEN